MATRPLLSITVNKRRKGVSFMSRNGVPKIVVIGSFVTDLMSKSPHLPSPGQTLMGGPFFMGPGGKGSNQAIAAAKLGAEVDMVVSLGNDHFGDMAYDALVKAGVGVEFVKRVDSVSTGIALIIVDDSSGENMIVVAPGANDLLDKIDVEKARRSMNGADCVVMQLEVPLEIVEHAAKLAQEAGVRVILDPAPGRALSDSLLSYIDVLTPNEDEASIISGIEVTDLTTAEEAARALHSRGPQTVVITLGSGGVLALDQGKVFHIPAFEVETIDTTGAGDAFNGAFAVALAEGRSVYEACRFAAAAAALSVTKVGTSVASPRRSEVEKFLRGTL